MKGREGRKGFSHIISIIIVFLCFYIIFQCLREYYVSPTGTTEGDCTQQSAPCSLSYAISIASIYAETTTTNIYLLPGSYQQKMILLSKTLKISQFQQKLSTQTLHPFISGPLHQIRVFFQYKVQQYHSNISPSIRVFQHQ